MNILKYTPEYKKDWDTFIDLSKNPLFMHKRDFMEYHSDRYKDNSLLFFDNAGNLLSILPANINKKTLYSHQGLTYGGFITNTNMKQEKMLECFEALKLYMKNNNIERLLYKAIPHIYHIFPAEEDLYALFINNAQIIKIEPSTTINLLKPCKMPKGRKAQISRAKREGVVIEQSNDFASFIELENKVLSEHHNTKAIHSAEELELLYSRFCKQIQLWIAKYNNEIIAASLIFVYENTVHTQYLASNDIARKIGGLDLLIKTLIDKFSSTHKYFDFGISTEDGGKYLNEGLISQKEGFGGRTTAYFTYELKV